MNMRIFLIAGEASGDQLGAGLMQALRRERPDIAFFGVGGAEMQAAGLTSLFPLDDIAVMGFLPVLKRLPELLKRIETTTDAVLRLKPDILVIIDSPDFTHPVARRVRKMAPDIPIVDYVSPTVWAWRPGRAAKMRLYIDHVLALLPFEPAAHRRLGGPPCTYVGHSLIERMADLAPSPEDLRRRELEPPLLVVLPGSRLGEIERLMPVFAATLEILEREVAAYEAVLPAAPHLEGEIRKRIETWRVRPRIVTTEAEKFDAFRKARVALAASGTVTLELALARVPMVVAYRVSRIEAQARHFINVPSIVLPNLILGENAIPEFLQERCEPEALAKALAKLIVGGPEREGQSLGFMRLVQNLRLAPGETPSARAADVILSVATKRGERKGSR
jgi:lipid-A-disaccharide synthase